jgi:hypothetical protein
MSKLPGQIDAEAILQMLADVRRSIPYELRPLPQEGKASPIAALDAETMTDFELETVAEGVERLSAELSQALERARAKAVADALRIYYAAEELARDPANAHLIPHVEAMRRAYEHDYGVPIPSKSSCT